jgi:biotin carboxyl carrier protein
MAVGMHVRAGDRLGTVDVLGVREDVVAPVDGVIGLSLAEAGEAVEYGQELVRIELPENSRVLAANGADREAAAVLGEA